MMVSKIFRLILLMLLFLPVFARAIQAQQREKAQPGKFQVNISKDYLSLEAQETPLPEIFKEISKQAKITFESNIGPEERITIRLDRVPLEEGIKQLAKNVTVFYAEDSNKTPRITRVVIISEEKGTIGRAKASPERVKGEDPLSKSEPFKFEFDPAKSPEKKGSRKQP
jgi:hypothetical protein